MSNELRKNLPDDVVARLEALQKVEEVTEETQVEKNLPKMELPIWFDGKQINEILLYVVRYHFNEDTKETMQEKINRMLVTEASRQAVY